MKKSIMGLSFVSMFLTTGTINCSADSILVNDGWNLRGTSASYATMDNFNKSCIQYVWVFDDYNTWKVYSPSTHAQEIITKAGYETLSSIDKKYGFWVLADSSCEIESSLLDDANSSTNSVNLAKLKASWQNNIGSTGFEDIRSMSVDNDGNVYVAGVYNGNIDGLALSKGSGDIFVAKYNATNGALIWIKTLNSANIETPTQIAYSSSDNTLVMVGYTTGSLDLNPDDSTLMNKGAGSFVVKLNANDGVFVNATSWETTKAKFLDIDIDSIGNLYLTGSLYNYSQNQSFDVNPSTSVFNMTTKGYSDGLIVKLNKSFGFVWAKNDGTQSKTTAFTSAILDGSDHIRVSGLTTATIPSSSLQSSTTRESLIKTYSITDGNLAIAHSVEYFDEGAPLSIGVTSKGESVICGLTTVSSSFLSSTYSLNGAVNLLSYGSSSLFVAKFDSYGNEQWRVQANSFGQSGCYDLEIDAHDNIFVAGEYDGSMIFGDFTIDSNGGTIDSFVAQIDSNGTVSGMKSFGGYQKERIQRMKLHDNAIYATGWFNGILTFNPEFSSLASVGNNDGFVVKLAQ